MLSHPHRYLLIRHSIFNLLQNRSSNTPVGFFYFYFENSSVFKVVYSGNPEMGGKGMLNLKDYFHVFSVETQM